MAEHASPVAALKVGGRTLQLRSGQATASAPAQNQEPHFRQNRPEVGRLSL